MSVIKTNFLPSCLNFKVLVGNVKGKDHVGDMCLDGRIILKWVLKKGNMSEWTGFSWIRVGINGGVL
jgi:hypothetical protein